MNIINFAKGVLNMDKEAREIAIFRLTDGLKNDKKWDEYHKEQIKRLVRFLKSDSNDISDFSNI